MRIFRTIKTRLIELGYAFRSFIGLVISMFYRQQHIWLLSERGHEARDNAYVFYLFLKRNHPEINVRYVIGRDDADLSRIAQEDVIYFGTWQHYIYMWRAEYLISTHICGYTPHHYIFSQFDRVFRVFRNSKVVFLQHGITKDNLPNMHKDQMHADLFISGAAPEYEYLKTTYGFGDDGTVQYTGFCRYDNLLTAKAKDQILLMPTWRQYIDKKDFCGSLYYKTYKALLESPELHSMLEKYHVKLIFYPHYEIQQFLHHFKGLNISSDITIAGFEYDVQQLLKESAALITDYSSVYFDMAYMNKPIIYYQFDKDEFFKKHYERGYIDESSMGIVTKDLQQTLSALEKVLQNHCVPEETYLEYNRRFFRYHDDKNCERVYNAILNIKKA